MASVDPRDVDYSVYLVTDSTPAVLGPGRSVVDVVTAAFANSEPGSIGIVQLREKSMDAREMLATLEKLHVLTAAAAVASGKPVPLLVNDRVDVAVAAMARGHCEGVHLGQDDIDVATARRMLGPGAIVGVTASTPREAVQACRDGADYLGLGTVFPTATKTDTKHVAGPTGVQRMLQAVVAANFGHVRTVCIGGVHVHNARRVMYQSTYTPLPEEEEATAREAKALDGVAVVSAIMGAADPGAAATALAEQVHLGRTEGPTAFCARWQPRLPSAKPLAAPAAGAPSTAAVQRILRAVHETTPLSHNMTNMVVQNIAANVALAVGASPIMSNNGAEAADLARLPHSALVVNMGTVTGEGLANYAQAIAAYNAAGRPVILDPVGAGATATRRAAVRTLLRAGYIDVIKGNEGEIQAVYQAGEAFDASDLAGLGVDDDDDDTLAQPAAQQRGVDGGNALDGVARSRLVRRLAARERCVVVLTGEVDYVSDAAGERLVAVAEGHPVLGQVTGMGCCLGTVLSAAVAAVETAQLDGDPLSAADYDTFSAVIAGMLLFERAAVRAVALPSVSGPGSFVPAFLDELASCRRMAARGEMAWASDLPE